MPEAKAFNQFVQNFQDIGHWSAEAAEIAYGLALIEELNFGNKGFKWDHILGDMSNPRGVTILLSGEEGQVLGYTCAIPALEAYRTNLRYYGRRIIDTGEDVAYIVNTSLHPHWQRQGLVWGMLEQLEKGLRSKGYSFLDRDVTGEHYFGAVMNRYEDRITDASGPTKTVYGDQWYLRMRL